MNEIEKIQEAAFYERKRIEEDAFYERKRIERERYAAGPRSHTELSEEQAITLGIAGIIAGVIYFLFFM